MYRNSEKEKEALTSNAILSPACINRKNQLPFMKSIGLQPKLKNTSPNAESETEIPQRRSLKSMPLWQVKQT